MMFYFDGIIVVEGKNDVSFLSSFIDSLYVVTNGYDLPKEEIDFLQKAATTKKIIVLTDSDEAGKQIRDKLNSYNFSHMDAEVDIAKCNKNGKHGVAECDKEEVVNVLIEHLSNKPLDQGVISTKDLLAIGVTNKEERSHLSKELHLGKCNTKQLVKRINALNITKKQIEEVMETYCGN